MKKLHHFLCLNLFVLTVIQGESAIVCREPDYRREMRDFVESISLYGKNYKSDFIIIPQNGQELISENGEADGKVISSYLGAIDAVGREDLFYGYTGDNLRTPANESRYMISFLQRIKENDVEVLVIDYCSNRNKMDRSYEDNASLGFVSFAAESRSLDIIPDYPVKPVNENDESVTDLSQVNNFLYLINPGEFDTRQDMIEELSRTNYDLLIVDLFDNDGIELSGEEIRRLQFKKNGGSRLVLAYMSIGEAEDYRYYWRREWSREPPSWIDEENPQWKGNYKVHYWDPDWQKFILGDETAYLDKILHAGFDGVYLDIIDAFYYFETK
jgi:cysteinyl-tRNA synthetase